jgi:L-asparaginase
LYVDNRHGVCACTHIGEMTIRAGTARTVVSHLKRGASAAEACHEALEDLRSLKGGYLGPVVVHVMDREGNPHVAGINLDESESYWYWREGMANVESREVLSL